MVVVVVALEAERGLALPQRQGNPLAIEAVAVAVDAADVVVASEREACADVASSTQPLLELS